MDKIKLIEQEYTKKQIPDFKIGDTVRVMSKILEGDRVRLHPFEGIVIAKKENGLRSSFTVRKISYGEGVERVFPRINGCVARGLDQYLDHHLVVCGWGLRWPPARCL